MDLTRLRSASHRANGGLNMFSPSASFRDRPIDELVPFNAKYVHGVVSTQDVGYWGVERAKGDNTWADGTAVKIRQGQAQDRASRWTGSELDLDTDSGMAWYISRGSRRDDDQKGVRIGHSSE
jgi:hypothetical protein